MSSSAANVGLYLLILVPLFLIFTFASALINARRRLKT